MSTCLHCGDRLVRKSGPGRPPMYCGNACRLARGKLLGKTTGARIPCSRCGQLRYATHTSAAVVICQPCRRIAHGLRPDQSVKSAKASGLLTQAKRRGICHHCKAPVPAGTRRWKYCSDDCFHAVRRAKGHGFPKAKKPAGQRGYGAEHQALRAQLLPLAYGQNCPLCGDVMEEGQPLHLDHNEDRTGYRGMVHGICNLRDGARRGRERQRQQVLERGWRHGSSEGPRRRTASEVA